MILISNFLRHNNNFEFAIVKSIFWKYTTQKIKQIFIFIAPLLKLRFSVPVKWDETAIFNPGGETLKVGLQTALSSRFTCTENQILKTVAMKNSMHYSKQNTANATRVTAALASLGQQIYYSNYNSNFGAYTSFYAYTWI